jgi:predicted metal-dependent hydrolase
LAGGLKVVAETVIGTAQCGATAIPYTVIYRKRRRNLTIEVHPDKSVTIHAPLRASQARIRDLVEQKAPWIERKIAWFDTIRQFTAPKDYVDGEIFLYLGRQYRLAVHDSDGSPRVILQGGYIDVSVPYGADDRGDGGVVCTPVGYPSTPVQSETDEGTLGKLWVQEQPQF